MAFGERIKACRQKAGISQEKVAELVGVSRQAVTKWEANQSAPSTENLFKLAEIFGTTVDLLLSEDAAQESTVQQLYCLYQLNQEKKAALKKQAQTQNVRLALLIVAGYLAIYLLGRILWCTLSQSTFLGWLFIATPSGTHSYLYGWLLSSRLFWYAMGISVIPALLGKRAFPWVTLAGFLIGLTAGMLFGPYPAGAALGHGHYGWAIWGAVFLISIAAGIILERIRPKEVIQ